jgi:hypothetical protein
LNRTIPGHRPSYYPHLLSFRGCRKRIERTSLMVTLRRGRWAGTQSSWEARET